jgi:hypothetical protein
MRRTVFAAVLFAFAALVTPAFAQSEEDVLAQIEALHGKSDAFGEAFGLLQDSFLFGDPQTLADLAVYPLTVRANGETYDVLSSDDFIDSFESLVTPETVAALSSQDFADLIVTSDGVGFANGALWMSLVCVDDSCSDSYWGIIAINN